MNSKTISSITNDEAKPAVVPKLRFPEFREAEGWATKPLSEVCSKITQGGTPDTTKSEYWGGSICWITPAEMGKSDSPFLHESIRTITEQGLRDCSSDLLPVNSVILSVRAPIGHLAINTVPMAINQGCKGLIGSSALDYFFLYYSLVVAKPKLTDLGAGNTFKELSGSALKSFAIPLPSPAEQQKIAECLSSVDELMAAQARKVDALKTHKKGLMQQLFPREGETQPRLRFPEFQNAGEWEPNLLGEVVKSFKTGKLDANAMVENGQYRFYTCAKNYYQIDHYAFEGEALLVAGNGAHLGYIHHYIGKFNAYQRTYVLQDFKANVVFLRCLLDRYLPARIQFEKKDGNTPYIVLSTLTEMPLVIPRDSAEQQRIATCLSSLDALITAETQKHEALKTHKKGLMQQLFPSPEEMEA